MSDGQLQDEYDFLIAGSGFAGAVMAERLAAGGNTCLVVDRRDHIGGNAYDAPDSAGVVEMTAIVTRQAPNTRRFNTPVGTCIG